MTVENAVLSLVKEAIAAKGPISFSEYMKMALYSDPGGYYRRNVPGRGGDYLTSPTLSPHFAVLVARQFQRMWEEMGRPAEFRVTEVGAGGGHLARSVFECAPRSFLRSLKWCFIEPLASVETLQRAAMGFVAGPHEQALTAVVVPQGEARGSVVVPQTEVLASKLPGRTPPMSRRLKPQPQIEWEPALDRLKPSDGVVFANEVMDNVPCDLLEIREGGLDEIRIGLEDDHLVEIPFQLENDSDPAFLAKQALEHLRPGDRLEIRPAIAEWFRKAAQTLKRGYVLVIDYGDTEPDIWTSRPAGTLVTYRQEQLGFDPLEDPGQRDITAHVNFSQVRREATMADLAVASLVTQREWLRYLGFDELQERLKQDQRQAEGAGDPGTALRLLAERSRAAALAHKGGLGDLKVFLAAKGVPIPIHFESPPGH